MKKSSSKTTYHPKQNNHLSVKNIKKNLQFPRNHKTTSTIIHTESEHPNQTTTKKNSYSSISHNANILNRANSCAKISNTQNSIPIKNNYSKANILKIDQSRSLRGNTIATTNMSHKKNQGTSKTIKNTKDSLKLASKNAENYEDIHSRNQLLTKQNIALREQCLMLHENQIKSKQKIQALISRISEIKRNQVQQATQESQKILLEQSRKAENYQKNCTNQQCMAKKKKLQQQLYFSRLKIEGLETDRAKWQGSKQQLRQQYRGLLDQVRRMRGQ